MKQANILFTDRKIESKQDSDRWQFNFHFYNKLRSEAIMKIYNQVTNKTT